MMDIVTSKPFIFIQNYNAQDPQFIWYQRHHFWIVVVDPQTDFMLEPIRTSHVRHTIYVCWSFQFHVIHGGVACYFLMLRWHSLHIFTSMGRKNSNNCDPPHVRGVARRRCVDATPRTRKLPARWRSPLVHSLTPRKWFWIVLKSCFLVIGICISMGLRFVSWCRCPSSMSGLSWRVRSRSVWNTTQLSPNECSAQATYCHRVSILSRASGFSLCWSWFLRLLTMLFLLYIPMYLVWEYLL